MSETVDPRVNPNPPPKDYDGPCRETAQTMIKRMLKQKMDGIAGLQELLKVVEGCEPGSPLEEVIYNMMSRNSY